MRNISKFKYCLECAKKCKSQAMFMHFAIMLAPTKADYELCTRTFKRAVKHANKYVDLANYYGDNYE